MEEMLTHMPGMRTSVIQEWFELNPKKTVEHGQIWRLVTRRILPQPLRAVAYPV